LTWRRTKSSVAPIVTRRIVMATSSVRRTE
jgi:hypothetical protein